MTSLLDAARMFGDAGCCVIPARPDGSKAPAVRWEQYQIKPPSPDQLARWFGDGAHDGLGVVCGTVSGGLEMLEFEGRAMGLITDLEQLLADHGAAELWDRVRTGYAEVTPSGGLHLLYRVAGAAKRNTKLARRPATADELAENPADKVKVLIETRGEGGFVITAPSAGRTHPSGQAWRLLAGDATTIPTVTADERDLLYAVANMLDQMPAADPLPTFRGAPVHSDELRPGDDYNQRASWDDLLTPFGWKRTARTFRGAGAAWCRPGKEHGVSATTGTASDGVDRLYVFSSSTTFEPERPYSKFAAYAHLHHGGDLSAAASALRRAGYGSNADLTWPGRDRHPFDSASVSAYQDEQHESAPEPPTPEQLFAKEVEFAAHRLRVGVAARALIAAEQAADAPPFDAGLLGEILQRPPEPPYRADGLIPNEASALIVAQRKTGKTTLNLNLARSLILGEDFLGRFGVRQISGNVGLLNYEVSSAQIARWAHEVGIPHDRLCIANLRGRRNPLGNDEDKEKLAGWLRDHDCESLIVDPFGRAYTGVSQNDSGEVGAWLADLDRWARGEVGVADLALSVHAGWEGERSRGASALEDWGDTIITMTRRKAGESEEEEDGHRYLRAEGRDVDVDEDQLEYDPVTRLLTLTGSGGRKKASINLRVDKLVPVVVEYVTSHPACSQRDLEASLPFRKVDIRKAAEVAAVRGLIRRTSIGNGFSHMANSPNSRPEERVRPDSSVTESENGDSDALKSQYVDNPDNLIPLFQAQGEVRPGASRVRPGRTASSASPATIGAGREDAPRGACKNPSHSPLIKAGRWTCSDCAKTQEGSS